MDRRPAIDDNKVEDLDNSYTFYAWLMKPSLRR